MAENPERGTIFVVPEGEETLFGGIWLADEIGSGSRRAVAGMVREWLQHDVLAMGTT